MKVVWLPEAARNFNDHVTYVADRSPVAAIRMGDLIEASAARLVDHPALGRRGRVIGTRELAVPGTPYVIVYRLEPKIIVILRLLHGRQQWPPE